MTTIQIFGDIYQGTLATIVDQAKDADEVKVLIHSDGGDCAEGLAVYDYMRTSGKIWHTEVIGSCHSIATIILLGAEFENRSASTNSTALIHNVSSFMMDVYRSRDLEEVKNEMDNVENRIKAIYVDRTNIKEDEVSEIMDAEQIHNSEWLLDNGFISKINDYKTKNMNIKNILNRKGDTDQEVNSEPMADTETTMEEQNETPKTEPMMEAKEQQPSQEVKDIADRVSGMEKNIEDVRLAIADLNDIISALKQNATAEDIVNMAKEYTNTAIDELKGMITSTATVDSGTVNIKPTRSERLASIKENIKYTKIR